MGLSTAFIRKNISCDLRGAPDWPWPARGPAAIAAHVQTQTARHRFAHRALAWRLDCSSRRHLADRVAELASVRQMPLRTALEHRGPETTRSGLWRLRALARKRRGAGRARRSGGPAAHKPRPAFHAHRASRAMHAARLPAV